jgi:cytoskeletal protein RodZ
LNLTSEERIELAMDLWDSIAPEDMPPLSLEQIAAATKIGVRSLEAIERGDFRKLPGGIYNTSYIRQYARAIDYDESILLAYYANAMAGFDGNGQRSDSQGKSTFSRFGTATTAGS